jgi:hypothetical protein
MNKMSFDESRGHYVMDKYLLTEEKKKEMREAISLRFKNAKFDDIKYVREIMNEEEVLNMARYDERMAYFSLDYDIMHRDKIVEALSQRWSRNFIDFDQTKGYFIVFKENGNYHLLKNRDDFFKNRTGFYSLVRREDVLKCIWHNQFAKQKQIPIERRGGF